mmetsp:Transcript_44931/g.129807  ORF Transcript_44931/g.129807 Transcript_44931/m.129807 type:complete len:309 (-) Transcript_44931:80-1006(-)
MLIALTELNSLKRLRLAIPDDGTSVFRNNFFTGPSFKVQDLAFEWLGSPPSVESSALGDFLKRLSPNSNKSLSTFAFSHPGAEEEDLFQILENDRFLTTITFGSLGDESLAILAWSKWIERTKNSASPDPKNKIRKIEFSDGRKSFQNRHPEQSKKNLDVLLPLMQSQFPYLYEFGLNYGDWIWLRGQWAICRARMPPNTPLIEDDEWEKLWVQIECNYVGLALLGESHVPLGLWASVLSRATVRGNKIFHQPHDHLPEKVATTGLFCLIRGLYTTGLLCHHEEEQNACRTTSNPSAPAKRKRSSESN